MQLLDTLAGQKPQLTVLEFSLLTFAVAAAASGPFILGGAFTEFVAPTAAARKSYVLKTKFSATYVLPGP